LAVTSTEGDVLVLRALGLGDALTGVAALRGVRRAWPDRRLCLAGPGALGEWLRGLGVVDEVVPAQGLAALRWQGRDHVAVNLHGRGPQSHAVLAATRPSRLVAFATPDHPDGPQWRAEEHEVDRWCRLVSSVGGRCGPEDLWLSVEAEPDPGLVVLHPGAASPSRQWPSSRWSAVGQALAWAGYDVLVTGSAAERRLCEAVVDGTRRSSLRTGRVRSVCGELDVQGLAALVASARLLMCGDTGVAHLGTAVGTSSVLLFGPTSPHLWGPAIDHDRHLVLWHGDPRRPGDPHGAAPDPALLAIQVDEVLAASATALRRRIAPMPV
jgi:ADP-heptose:LPS heptosyltransferase